jgi:hypothetical protein
MTNGTTAQRKAAQKIQESPKQKPNQVATNAREMPCRGIICLSKGALSVDVIQERLVALQAKHRSDWKVVVEQLVQKKNRGLSLSTINH